MDKLTLREINGRYGTDKGVTHNYLNFYEQTFTPIRDKTINILEIGVLFGNSLRLWSDYFENGNIYGVDDFSQDNGHSFYQNAPVVKEEVIAALSKFNRVKVLVFNCEDVNQINSNLDGMQFDVIIDDASHAISQQIANYTNYHKFLKEDGVYICEDVQTHEEGETIGNHVTLLTPNKIVELHEFDLNKKSDDRILYVR